MFFIPGQLVALLTFPGVIVHEAAHMLFCRLRRVAILDVCFFRFGNPAGYVIHEVTPDFVSTFFVSLGPFFVNSILCLVFCLPAVVPVRMLGIEDPLSYFWLWLGVSIGMHAFPSTTDARNLWTHARVAAKRGHPLAIVSFPLVVLVFVANMLSFFWFDALYGIAVGLFLPEAIVRLLAR